MSSEGGAPHLSPPMVIMPSLPRAAQRRWFSVSAGPNCSQYLARSFLFGPGFPQDRVRKTLASDADVVMLDLEDAVTPSAKDQARAVVTEQVARATRDAKSVVIRINALDSPWGVRDLRQVARSGVRALVIPKAESRESILQLADMMTAAASPKDMEIWAMIETPLGVLQLPQIAQSHPRLTTLVAGTSDLAKDLKCEVTRDRVAVVTSLARIVTVARACHLRAIDGVCKVDDPETFTRQCHQGRQLGFDGKTLRDPKTIPETNRVFSPTEAELSNACASQCARL